MIKTKEAYYKSFNITHFGGDDQLREKLLLYDCEGD